MTDTEFSAVPWYARAPKPDAEPATYDRDGLIFEVKRLRELLGGGVYECDGHVVSAYDVSKAAKALAEAYHDTVFQNYQWWNDDADMFGGAPNDWRVRYETRPQWERLVREAFKMAPLTTQSKPKEQADTQPEKDEERGRVAHEAYWRDGSCLPSDWYDISPMSKAANNRAYDACAAHATARFDKSLDDRDRRIAELEAERDALAAKVRELEAQALPLDASALGRIDFTAYNEAFRKATGRSDSEPYDSDFHKDYMRAAIDAGAVAVARTIASAMLSDAAVEAASGAYNEAAGDSGGLSFQESVRAAIRAALAVALGPVDEVETKPDTDPCPVKPERIDVLGLVDNFGRESYSGADVAKVVRWLARREMARAVRGGR